MDRNLDERLRKPRRAKGTPFAQNRNYLAFGVLALSAVSLYIFEKLPVIQRFKRDLSTSNKFQASPEIREHMASMNTALNQPELAHVIKKYQDKKFAESLQDEEKPKKQPWYSIFYQNLYITKVPSKTETISRYFTKPDKKEDKHNQSVYQDAVTEDGEKPNTQLNSSNISDGDFVSPKPVKKLARIFSEVRDANKRATRFKSTRPSKKVVINEEKKLMHVAKTSDVNVEHLQLAMAMSKSMEPDLSTANENDENIYPSTQEIAENARQSLMAFRYNPHGLKSQKIVLGEGVRKITTARKKFKFRYVKPKLFTTTQEDRAKKIQEKISQIIANPFATNDSSGSVEEIVYSCTLQELVNVDKKLFRKSAQDSGYINDYYVDVLELDKTVAICGCLLKNWQLIPGRDASPQKKKKLNIVEEIGTTLPDEGNFALNQELERNENNGKFANVTVENAKKSSSVKQAIQLLDESLLFEQEGNLEKNCSIDNDGESKKCSETLPIKETDKMAMEHKSTSFTEGKVQVGTIDGVNIIKNYSSIDNSSDGVSASGTFASAQSCFFGSVSQLNRNTFRSTSPDLFGSSDEEMIGDKSDDAKFTTSYVPPQQKEDLIMKAPSFQNNCGSEYERNSNENQPSHADLDKDSFKKYVSASLISNMNAQNENHEKGEHSIKLKRNQNKEDTIKLGEVYELIGLTPKRLNFKEFASASQMKKTKAKGSNATVEDLNDSNQGIEINENGICTYESFCDYEEDDFEDSVRTASSDIIDQEMYEGVTIKQSKSTEKVNSSTAIEINEGSKDINIRNCGDNIDDSENMSSSLNEKHNFLNVSELPTPNQTYNHSYNNSALLESSKLYKTMNVTHHIEALLNSETFAEGCMSICVEKYFLPSETTEKAVNKDDSVDISVEKQNVTLENGDLEITIPMETIEPQEIVDDNADPENADFIDLSQDKIDFDDGCIDLTQELHDEMDNNDNQNVFRKRSFQISRNSGFQRNSSTNSLTSTSSTTDSIYISDEELNYSSMHATPKPNTDPTWRFEKLAHKNNKFAISESEEDDDYGKKVENEVEVSLSITEMLRVLQERKAAENRLNAYSEDDEDLQKAIKLSLLEAEIDEGRRQSQSDYYKTLQIDEKGEGTEIERENLSNRDNTDEDVINNEDDFGECSPANKSISFCLKTDEKAENELDNSQKQRSFHGITEDNVNFQDNSSIYIADDLNKGEKSEDHASASNKNDETFSGIVSVSRKINENDHYLHDSDHSFPSYNYDHFDDHDPYFSTRTPEKVSFRITNHESPMTPGKSPTENNADEFDCLLADKSVFTNIPTAIKLRRVQELITQDKTPHKQFNVTNAVRKRTSAMFEDTFANLLEQTKVLQNIDRIEINEATALCSNQNALEQPSKPPPDSKFAPIGSKITTQISRTPGTPADRIFVKSVDVTPMPMYENMTTPEIHAELDKIGLKHMKRRRGIEMLKHVYNSMHLQIERHDDGQVVDNQTQPNKRRKKLNYGEIDLSECDVEGELNYSTSQQGEIEVNSDIAESEPLKEMIFERTQSKKIKSCALPFHIAWFNFLCVNREIWKNVLLYVPLQVEVLYAMFKELGFKYHIQDMITFFDKKCITIRIKRNN